MKLFMVPFLMLSLFSLGRANAEDSKDIYCRISKLGIAEGQGALNTTFIPTEHIYIGQIYFNSGLNEEVVELASERNKAPADRVQIPLKQFVAGPVFTYSQPQLLMPLPGGTNDSFQAATDVASSPTIMGPGSTSVDTISYFEFSGKSCTSVGPRDQILGFLTWKAPTY